MHSHLQSKLVFHTTLFLISVLLLSAFSYFTHLSGYGNELFYEHTFERIENERKSKPNFEDDIFRRRELGETGSTERDYSVSEPVSPGEVILLDNYDSLFYHADVKAVIQQAIRGSPFNYLPEYRNPCWFAKIVSEDGVMPATWRVMEEVFRQRVAESANWRLRCFPLVHLIGFSKSGTSDLFRSLRQHPHIIVSKKEPLYWTFGRFGRNHTLEEYITDYDHKAEEIRNSIQIVDGQQVYPKIILDGSSTKAYYMDGWRDVPGHENLQEPRYTVAMTLRTIIPQAKIIAILRNPTERTYSRFRMFCTMCTPEQFHDHVTAFIQEMEECLQAQTIRGCAYNYTHFTTRMTFGTEQHSMFIRASLYYVYVRDWLDAFPRDQIYVTKAEHYYDNRADVMREIFTFLGLDNDVIAPETWYNIANKAPSNVGDSKGRITETMLNKTRALLDDFFHPYNLKLAALLEDNSFSWNQ